MSMEIPQYEPFYLHDVAQMRHEIARIGLHLPVSDDTTSLDQPFVVGRHSIANRWCADPISGSDARPDGAPSDLFMQREQRKATGGFGLIWSAGIAVTPEGRSGPSQMCLDEALLPEFAKWVRGMRAAARADGAGKVVLIAQLTHAVERAMHPLCAAPSPDTPDRSAATDAELEQLRDAYVGAAGLAEQAGFDGIDLCSRPDTPFGSLHGAFTRQGRYGKSFENRTRLLLETLEAIREKHPALLTAVRLCVFDARAYPWGFGVERNDYRRPDTDEPLRLARLLYKAGLALLGVVTQNPNLRGRPDRRLHDPLSDTDVPHEHPLTTLGRRLDIARSIRDALPELPMLVGGFTWGRHLAAPLVAGALADGVINLAGLGRGALAYPDAPANHRASGKLAPGKCCMLCHACETLHAHASPVGCVIRDATYGAMYRRVRRTAADRLMHGASRCHSCEAAPCVEATPGHPDIPGWIAALRRGRLEEAFRIVREHNVLPELSALLAPAWRQGEGACIETTLSGFPVPIMDMQLALSMEARKKGLSALHLPKHASGRRVTIVGGGPAGLGAASVLLESGHEVRLIEKRTRLGGTPEFLIPSMRLPDIQPEIHALLAPALSTQRLNLVLGSCLGDGDSTLERLRADCDALLLCTGIWQEQTLNAALPGVYDAVSFLEEYKSGTWRRRPLRAALLSGGDCAMDSATVLRELGVQELFVVFAGARSDMHWCMRESFFAEPGVHAIILARPMGYVPDDEGKLRALRVQRTMPAENGVRDLTDGDFLIEVDCVIEAMGLAPEDGLRKALPGLPWTDHGLPCRRSASTFQTPAPGIFVAGAICNGGASVPQCVVEGMQAAGEIDRMLTA